MPLFFWVNKILFGLNPLSFHLVTFFIHLINTVLLGYIFLSLFKKRAASILASILYVTAALHFMSLSWISLAWNPIGNFFLLFALAHYNRFHNKRIIVSISFFILALLSTEFAIVLPALVILLELYKNNFNFSRVIRENFNFLSSVSIFIGVYLFLRIIVYSIPTEGDYTEGDYQLIFNSGVLNNFFWYLLWLINVPEVLKYQVQISNLSFFSDQTFINPIRPYAWPLIISQAVFFISTIILIRLNFNPKLLKAIFTTLLFILISLIPVLFLSNHSFPYYLTTSSIGFFAFFAFLFTNTQQKSNSMITTLTTFLVIISWVVGSYLTISFTRITHWIPGEQNISKTRIEEITQRYSPESNSNVIELMNTTGQTIQSLMDQNALQVIYNNDDIETIYKGLITKKR